MELDGLSLELNRSNLEVNTNGRDVALCISIVCETEEETTLERITASFIIAVGGEDGTNLADTTVANEEELEEVVVFACVHCSEREEERKTSDEATS